MLVHRVADPKGYRVSDIFISTGNKADSLHKWQQVAPQPQKQH